MRLIDADRLRADVLSWEKCYNGFSDTYDKARIIDAIDEQPTIEPKRGKWQDREVFDYASDIVEEWQSARCSHCNKYLTTPYMYYFDNYKFCPNCGARMEGHGAD